MVYHPLNDSRAIQDRNPNATEAWLSLHPAWRLLSPTGLALHRPSRGGIVAAVYADDANQSTQSKPTQRKKFVKWETRSNETSELT